MPDLSRDEIGVRLDALYNDLGGFPAGVACPWPLARVFNELLRNAKRELADDPIVQAIAALRQSEGDEQPETANVLVGAVRGLAAQTKVALERGNGSG